MMLSNAFQLDLEGKKKSKHNCYKGIIRLESQWKAPYSPAIDG